MLTHREVEILIGCILLVSLFAYIVGFFTGYGSGKQKNMDGE